jgi:hypothetical protein
MNTLPRIWFWLTVFLTCFGTTIYAQGVAPPGGELVSHPVAHPTSVRTKGQWRQQMGQWGEAAARKAMRLRGYNEIHQPKLFGDRGIDLVAIRRGVDGRIQDLKLVEVKAHRGPGLARLSHTRHGRQMSGPWLRAKLRQMKNSGDSDLRRLAVEIEQYRSSQGVPLRRLGEVVDINTNTGTYTVRDPVNRQILAAGPAKRLFQNVQYETPNPATRQWAQAHLNYWDRIRARDVTDWKQRGWSIFDDARFSNSDFSTLRLRGLGLASAAIALAFDAYDLYLIYSAWYKHGEGGISHEEVVRTTSRIGVGILGAYAGGEIGAAVGGFIGLVGGPYAWATVPAGSLIGGGVGGMVGYYVGAKAGSYAADAWYDHLDSAVKQDLDSWVMNTDFEALSAGQK